MKTIKIPNSQSPFEVIINGVKHTYEAGATVEVEDYIAEVIERTIVEFIPEPGGISWNDLHDKPFGEASTGGDTIAWDGNIEGVERVGEGHSYCKITDIVPEKNDFRRGFSLGINLFGEKIDVPLGVDNVSVNSYGIIELGTVDMIYAFIVPESAVNDMGFPSKGIYVVHMDLGGGTVYYIEKITIPGYKGFPGIKPIDERFLPEYLRRPFGELGSVLTWDGNTEGLEFWDNQDGQIIYKVSDIVLDENDYLKGGIVALSDGTILNWTADGVVEVAGAKNFVVGKVKVCLENNNFGLSAGTYFEVNNDNDGVYVTKFALYDSNKLPEIYTKRMDEKYMPLLTAPNGTKYKLSVSDDGTLAATAV